MSKTALFIRHRAKPGQREQVRRIWDRYVRPRVETNPGHLAYNFCYDDADPDMICVFQLYTDKQAMEAFLKEPWYPEYLREVSQVVVAPPEIRPATLVWNKSPAL